MFDSRFEAHWILLAVVMAGCGDDVAGGGNEDGSGTSTGPETAANTSSTSGPTMADESGNGGLFCDDRPQQGEVCDRPSEDVFAFWMGLPSEYEQPHPHEEPCTVYAVVRESDWFRQIGLSCELADFAPDQIVIVELGLNDELSTPLRPGDRLLLSAEPRGGLVMIGWNFTLRDEVTGEIELMGFGGIPNGPEPELFDPFSIQAQFGVCGFVDYPLEGCVSAAAQFAWVVSRGDQEVTLLDYAVATLEEMHFLSTAVEYFIPCPAKCNDFPSSHAVLLGSPHFDDPPLEGCHAFSQDCPSNNLRCVPSSQTPGVWDTTTCVPVGMLSEGEACELPDPMFPADECGPGLICVAGDEPMFGSCRPQCTGTLDVPTCPAGTTCNLDPVGALPPLICVLTCDPLAQDCPDPEDACFNGGDLGFICVPPGTSAVGDPCQYINSCVPGSTCIDAQFFDECMGDFACCAAFCSVSGDPCPEGTECIEFFDEEPVPGYEGIGVCGVPPARAFVNTAMLAHPRTP